MHAEQLTPELAALGPDYIYVPLPVLAAEPERLEPFTAARSAPVVVLPRIIRDAELRQTAQLLEKARSAGVTQALIGSLGHVALARMAGMDARGDYSLNVFNSYSMEIAARAGLLSATASFELTMEQIKQLSKPLDTEIIVYGGCPPC